LGSCWREQCTNALSVAAGFEFRRWAAAGASSARKARVLSRDSSFAVGLPLAPAMGLPLLKRRSCRRRALRTAGGGARGGGIGTPSLRCAQVAGTALAVRHVSVHANRARAARACPRIAHAPARVRVERRARFERVSSRSSSFAVGLPLAPAMGLPLLKRRSCRRRAFRTAGRGARGGGIGTPSLRCAEMAGTALALRCAGVHANRARTRGCACGAPCAMRTARGGARGVGLAPLANVLSKRMRRCPGKVSPQGAACCIPIVFAIPRTAPWAPHAAFPYGLQPRRAPKAVFS